MNPFDANTQGLEGIGSDLKKFGRSIDSHVRGAVSNINNFVEDSVKNSFTTQGKFFTATVEGKLSKAGQDLVDGVKTQYELTEDAVKAQNHINIELNRATVEFLATDIGKIIAVIAICVAMVMGAGPIILEGLKQAMLAAKAGAQYAIKAGAKYLAKQLTTKELAKRAASYVIKKEVGKYQDKKMAEEEAKLIAQYEKEYEAMIEKQYLEVYGQPLEAAMETPKAQPIGLDGKPIPYGFTPPPSSKGSYVSPTRHMTEAESRGRYYDWANAQTRANKANYINAKNKYLAANPKIAASYAAVTNGLAASQEELAQAASIIDENARAEMMSSLDAAIKSATEISSSPEVLDVANQLRAQGKSEAEIQRIWASSELFKDSTKAVVFDASLPAVREFVSNVKEYPPEIQRDVEIIIANNVAEIETQKAVAKEKGSVTPLLLIGGLAALFLAS